MTAYRFRLRFPESDIPRWSRAYGYGQGDLARSALVAAIRSRGYLTRRDLMAMCYWKSPRTQPRVATNDSATVQELTRVALATSDEEAKMALLRQLHGVSWPSASVILHFCDRRPYPILDVRALWSLGYVTPPRYDFPFWWAYTDFLRRLRRRTGRHMRTIDRALWQYSAERQP
jgi:hypothetical protein